MPRYYFDSTNDTDHVTDAEGSHFPDLESAKKEAARTLCDIAKDAFAGGKNPDVSIQVSDAQRRPILRACLLMDFLPSE